MAASHIKYFLGTIDRNFINDQIEISRQNYDFSYQVLKDFIDLINDEKLFRVVELNYEELKSKISYYTSKVKENPNAGLTDSDTIFIDINRHLLNLLSTIRTFLDHKETTLKRKFGKESDEFLRFEKETNIAFDNNFEYRFIYKLRNYAQHCGLPAGPPETKSYMNTKSEVQNDFNIYFDRNKLLSDFDWGIKVKNDLALQPEKFNILPVIDKVHELLNSINTKINDHILQNYKAEGETLLNLIKRTVGFVGMPCLMKREGVGTLTYYVNWFPLEHISKVTGTKINFNYI